ncbi:tyrosine-protein phosphatase non-receptor type 23 [Caerostris extrusa]|uniref:Tyrosine-protein phosphatase non-receptor type 23 n=1 Tax=Caerostris extrusa TaxID=172846 RepID=A0AAV4XHL6_CAEEX|nr:tyrosine-protein phosphatase non-receptor type 23 [Caerostris extrusa]
MEAVPRLPMISCDMKISPQNTEFGRILRKNAIKAPMDFTGCSILKRYYSQLHKLGSRFPMTDDGPACVPFMWTDIYSGLLIT